MMVTFEFASFFSSVLGIQDVAILVTDTPFTLEGALAALFKEHPDYLEKLQAKNYANGDSFPAIFTNKGTLLSRDTVINENAHIRVLPPICGG
jgi:molybdopterin converting factor small subunit